MAVYDPAAFREVFEHHFTYLAGLLAQQSTATPAAPRCTTRRPAGAGPTPSWARTRPARGRAGRRTASAPGDVVVFQLFNSPEFALLYLAAQRLGAIGSPINFRLSAGETAFVLDDSKPAVFVYDASLADAAATALDLAEHQPDAVFVVDGEKPCRPSTFGRC